MTINPFHGCTVLLLNRDIDNTGDQTNKNKSAVLHLFGDFDTDKNLLLRHIKSIVGKALVLAIIFFTR